MSEQEERGPAGSGAASRTDKGLARNRILGGNEVVTCKLGQPQAWNDCESCLGGLCDLSNSRDSGSHLGIEAGTLRRFTAATARRAVEHARVGNH